MSQTGDERLIVLVEARIKDLERNMAKASGTTGREFGKMRKDAKSATKEMEQDVIRSTSRINQALAASSSRIGAFGAGALKGFGASLAAVGIAGAVKGFRDLANSVAMIGNEARRAGLSTKAFQELSFVASQTRIPVDALVDGMKELSLRADEFIVTGGGSAADAFKRIGYDAATLKAALKDPSALLVDIVAKLQRLDKAAQIRIFDELFGGTGGEQFVELLNHGSAGIKQMIADANAFGLVMDEEMIAKADEVDRKFDLLAKTVGTGLKRAIVEASEALGDFMDQFNETEKQQAGTLRQRIQRNFQEQAGIQDQIGQLKEQQNDPIFPWMKGANEPQIKLLEGQLAKLNSEYAELQSALDKYTGMAGDSLKRLGDAADSAAGKIGDVPAAVHGRVAEKGNLEPLNRYNIQLARDAAKGGMLDLIGFAEGTDKGRGYNETLANGKFTGGDVNLTAMTLKEVLTLQKQMLAHPDNTFNSSAVGRYQIVSKTMKGLMGDMGLSGDEFFTKDMQDRMAEQLLRRRGNDVSGLRNEWEGLRRVPDDAITGALGVTQPGMAPRDEGVQAAIDKRKELADSYNEIVARSTEFVAAQNLEARTIGMTAEKAAALRYEQELLNEAAAAGLDVTPQRAAQFKMIAEGMAEAEASTESFRQSQDRLAETREAFGDLAKNGLKGFISDLQAGKSAGEALANTLSRVADRLLDMSLDGLFSGGKAGGGLGGLLGSLFGGGGDAWAGLRTVTAASGGYIRGPGTSTSDSIPAMLSDGEYVVKASAVTKHRSLLEAINGDEVRHFARGGYIGAAPTIPDYARIPMPSGDAGSRVVVNDMRTSRGSEPIETRETTDADGNRQIEIMVRDIVDDQATRESSSTNRKLRSNYGLTREVMRR